MAYSNAGPFVLHSFWGDGAVLAGDRVGGGRAGLSTGVPGAGLLAVSFDIFGITFLICIQHS